MLPFYKCEYILCVHLCGFIWDPVCEYDLYIMCTSMRFYMRSGL